MQHLYEKVSYLRGLCDGMELSKESKEGKALAAIVETLEEFAGAIVELYEEQKDLSEYVEFIDEDLADIEDELYEDEDLEFVKLQCPSCGEEVEVDEDLLYDETQDILCPACDEVIIHAEEDEEGEDIEC